MAHPFDSHRADKVGKARVSKLHGFACGGTAKKYASGGAVAAPKKFAAGGEIKVQGRASGGRLDKYARGGKTKHKGTQVNIAIVQPKGGNSDGEHPAGGPLPASGGPPPMARPPMPPPGPPGAGGPGIPGMPPGGPLAGPMKPPGMMKRGGKVTGIKGGDNGVGRKNKAAKYGLKPIK